mmetsp:Transcript_15851/g.21825  ORF Transcript_15851/g.21825 Transcript_15851/m.21825 type:complete len:544 (-) Transcript_15851:437-2068(-)
MKPSFGADIEIKSNLYSSINEDEILFNDGNICLQHSIQRDFILNSPEEINKESDVNILECCSCCFGVSSEYASPIPTKFCSFKNLARQLFMPNRSDSVLKLALLSICGTIICPYVLLPVNLYFICRGICFPLFYGHNFSLARSDSCFCVFSPFLCTTGNTSTCLCFRLCLGSTCTCCNCIDACLDSLCGRYCSGRMSFGDRILSSYCPCHVDYVNKAAEQDIRGYKLDAASQYLEEFFGIHHTTAFERYTTMREDRGRLIKYRSASDGSALHGAALSNNTTLLNMLMLCFCARTDTVDSEGNTALIIALKHRKFISDDTIRLLIDRSDVSHINIQNNAGNTALHIACYEEVLQPDDKILALLSQKHFDLCMRNNEGNTVVHIACLHGHTHLAKQFLRSRHACPPLESITNDDGDTILHVACKKGLWEVVEQVIFFIHNFSTDMSAYELLYETRNNSLRVPIDYVTDATLKKKLFILQDPRLKELSYDIRSGEAVTITNSSTSNDPSRSKSIGSRVDSNMSSNDDEFILIGEGVDVEQLDYSLS